jgi:hypothetical protein
MTQHEDAEALASRTHWLRQEIFGRKKTQDFFGID